MTLEAIHDAISSIEHKATREHAVWERLQTTMEEFEQRSKAPHSELRAITYRAIILGPVLKRTNTVSLSSVTLLARTSRLERER